MGVLRQRLFAHLHGPHSHREALRFGQERLSRADVWARASHYAQHLKGLGLAPGDRVAVLLESDPRQLTALVGHHLLGAIHVPVNTRYRTGELAHILEDSAPAAILVDWHSPVADVLKTLPLPPSVAHVLAVGDLQEPLERPESWSGILRIHRANELLGGPQEPSQDPTARDWPDISDEATALFVYTSGTTGPAKAVELSFRAIVAGIGALVDLWQFSADDRLVLALPLYHVHGLCIGLHGALLNGVCVELLPRFDAGQVLAAIEHGASIFMGVPTMYAALVEAMERDPEMGPKLAGARLFTSGSAALDPRLFEAFLTHTGHRILERYGMSETLLTFSNPYDGERRPGTVGMPVGETTVRIVGDDGQDVPAGVAGELWVQGPSLMSGYWRATQKTAESFREGYFVTGDVAVWDAEGYVRIVGRSSVDIIKSGGFKIAAGEIEAALTAHPEVREAAVVGLEDLRWGEVIAAAVVLHPLPEHADWDADAWLAELSGHVAGQLADYKRPRRIIVLHELPRNALGKVQKHLVRALLAPAIS